jgi:predicted nucleic acid-binding protein
MGAMIDDLPENGLLLLDAAPVIYVLEGHPTLGSRFRPLFEAQAQGRLRFATTTITIAEVMTGPLKVGDEARARQSRAILESWRVVTLDSDVAENAARLRASLNMKLYDAVVLASALAINADAIVTHDRDFSRVKELKVIS